MSVPCRLCDHDCVPAFRRTLLHRLTVQYFSCPNCAALQTEEPTWLDEAYGSAIAALDTGIVTRNLVNQAVLFLLARILKPQGRLVDFGGGTGMLCRLMRDIGFDAYLMDRYADPVFARGFGLEPEAARAAPVAILSCFEVFEHLSAPAAEIDALFALKPALLVASTKLCDGQGADWPYLVPETGQHVFFYARRTMETIAAKQGYSYINRGDYHLFVRDPVSSLQRILIRLTLSRPGLLLARMMIALRLGTSFAQQDQARLNRG
jgi:hypothetical protein